MSFRTKLAIAVAVGCAAVCLFIAVAVRLGRDAPGAERVGARGEGDASERVADGTIPTSRADADETPSPARATADSAPRRASGSAWTLAGRVVRRPDPGTGGADPASLAAARVVLASHPRLEKDTVLAPREVLTADDGRFELDDVPARVALRLEIDAPASARRAFSLTLGSKAGARPSETRRADLGDIVLEPASAVTVIVRNLEGAPVDDAEVVVNTSAGHASRTEEAAKQRRELGVDEDDLAAIPSGDGHYVLERAPPGPLTAKASAPGFVPSTPVPFDNPQSEPLVIELTPGRVIAGVVVSTSGAPIASALVFTYSRTRHETTTEGDGRFRLDTLPGGETFYVRAEATGYVSALTRNVLSDSDDVVITMTPEAVLSGRVVLSEDETPVADAKVTIELTGVERGSFEGTSEGDGRFEVRKAKAGAYLVTIDHAEFATLLVPDPIELAEGERLDGGTFELGEGLRVAGTVVDAGDATPVADADVTFALQAEGRVAALRKATTNADGAFELAGLVAADYDAVARAEGYIAAKGRIVTIAAETAADVVTLEIERGASIAGRVLDPDGRPLAGATVRPEIQVARGAWDATHMRFRHQFSMSATSDGDGRFRLAGLLPHPTYRLRAEHTRYASAESVELELFGALEVEDVDIRLGRGGGIAGRVTDDAGEGLTGIEVAASRKTATSGDGWLRISDDVRVSSRGDGRFVFERLRAGSYTVHARAPDRLPAERLDVAVVDGELTDGIDLALRSGHVLTGRVVDREGQPLEGVSVHTYAPDSKSTSTTEDGRFRLAGLAEGPLNLGFGKSGFAWRNVDVTLPRGDELVLELRPAGTVLGIVRSVGARSIGSEAQITVIGVDLDAMMWTFSNGGRFQLDLEPGTYRFRATVAGLVPGTSVPVKVEAGAVVDDVVIELADGATIVGVTVDAASGEPVTNATVTYREPIADARETWGTPSVASASDGAFRITGVPEGPVALVATRDGYVETVIEGVRTVAGETIERRVELRRGGVIEGVVRRGGIPVEGASLVVTWLDGDPSRSTSRSVHSSADGRYRVAGLGSGEYAISGTMDAAGVAIGIPRHETRVVEGQTTQVDIDVPLGIVVRGRVRAGGKPFGGARLFAVSRRATWQGATTQVGPDGRYAMEVPAPGVYTVTLRTRSWLDSVARIELEVPPDVAVLERDIELPSGEILGTVVDAATGAPIAEAKVAALEAGARARSVNALRTSIWATGATDERGRFTLRRLVEGEYSVRVSATGYTDATVPGVRVREAPTRLQPIALEHGVEFTVRVVDERGRPVSRAAAVLRDAAGNVALLDGYRWAGTDGVVSFSGIEPGAYRLAAGHASFATTWADLAVAEGMEEVVIVLRRGGEARVVVLGPDGRPVEGAAVRVLDANGVDVALARLPLNTAAPAINTTQERGRLDLGVLAPGEYTAAASEGERRAPPAAFTVRVDERAEVTLTLAEAPDDSRR